MQFQADIIDRPVLLPAHEELSALGASWLAGLALGWWCEVGEIAALARAIERYSPMMNASERECRYEGWKAAVNRACLKTELHP